MITVYGIETADLPKLRQKFYKRWNDMITVYGIETFRMEPVRELCYLLERYDYRLRYWDFKKSRIIF